MAARGTGGQQDAMNDITRLNTRAVRILGQNPSSFTLNGTSLGKLTRRDQYVSHHATL